MINIIKQEITFCTYIDDIGTMMGQDFFEKLEYAKQYFDKGV